jgi:hypothetical protein
VDSESWRRSCPKGESLVDFGILRFTHGIGVVEKEARYVVWRILGDNRGKVDQL